MNNEELVLSNESGFQGDWKTIYHRDALLWASHEYDTDSIMKPLAQMVIGLANQFHLSPTIEFTTIDTLELLLVRAFQSWMQSPVTFPDTVEQQKDAFLRQLPMYVVAVFDIVAKYSNLGSKLDLAAMKRAAKLRSSLLLGAFERFSKQYLLPLNIESKETIASIGVRLLRVAVAERALIYDSLKTSMKDMECFRRFKSNKLILAGAIILTVLYLIPAARHSSVLLNQVAVPLADDCCVQSTNLIYLRDAILRVIGGH
ncbi:uncharacterized protein LOC120903563 isoform X2 [Anopheles arabiensis]|uniref:uncharacterized protein LOC120903563 isoform X2 n=1 Tax=Anopheles arabiensis TaxID=7173 RepID=UPI001AACCEB6|nr:uncharacterized protein LOC120903563 isoform X2 [Anopheles arabiensis]